MTFTNTNQPSVLMVGGATYTDRVLCAFTKHLIAAKPFHCAVIGMDQRDGQPGGVDLAVFDRVSAFPGLRKPKSAAAGLSRMAFDLASCSISSGVYAGAAAALRMGSVSPLRNAIRRKVYDRSYAYTFPSLVSGFSLYHWHCMHWDRLSAIRFLPSDATLILTIWGSDLLRSAGIENYRVQLAACERAQFITVGSVELREVLLAKFGRSLSGKIRLATYGADYLDVCHASSEQRAAFLQRLHIPIDRIVLCVGHSGHRQNQHLAVLTSLRSLPAEVREQIAIILPMTYGLTQEYRREVLAAGEALNVPVHVFDTFMPDEDVAMLRQSSDLFVHVPISDQFSAAMCESLAAGAVLITGAWLPYSRLRLNHIHFREVADVSDVASQIQNVIDRLVDEKVKCESNADRIRAIMSWSQVMPRWLQIYDEALSVH